MKKLMTVVVTLILALAFAGCNSEEQYSSLAKDLDDVKEAVFALETEKDALNTQLTSLQTEKDALDTKIETLNSALTNLQTEKIALNAKINALDATLTNTQTELAQVAVLEAEIATLEQELLDLKYTSQEQASLITSLQTQLTNINNKLVQNVNIFLPKEYYLAVGDTFQLFYRSVVQAVDPYQYYIKLTGTKGYAYPRYYEWTPAAADYGKTFNLKMSICDNNGNVISEKTTKLIVSTALNPSTTKNILCIGDSLTANGYWVAQGIKKYNNAGATNIVTLGTITSTFNGVTIKHEGHGGWQWSSYLNGYATTPVTPSPFWNANNQLDFKYYCSTHGYATIDEAYILMTWNGIGGSFREFSFASEPFASAKIFIDKLHADYPHAKITLMGIPLPSVNGGLSAYYTLDKSYADNYGQLVTAMKYNQFLEDFCNMAGYSSFMRYVDVKGQFDSEYNMPTSPKPVNTESSITEPIGTSMGMHPNTDGYEQIGDAFYRALCHRN
ncbi:MAG TPA: hypothetical protein PLW60_04380 [Bacilli bacterium]|nr:MAG: Chromosome partition protein Smc [Tenericutes bacterium ADurb.BinA124]HPX84743.1 hypothetical protein [Bacilli bacterium]HQC74748.1 hypothetical protein [Bacilli bacterium]